MKRYLNAKISSVYVVSKEKILGTGWRAAHLKTASSDHKTARECLHILKENGLVCSLRTQC